MPLLWWQACGRASCQAVSWGPLGDVLDQPYRLRRLLLNLKAREAVDSADSVEDQSTYGSRYPRYIRLDRIGKIKHFDECPNTNGTRITPDLLHQLLPRVSLTENMISTVSCFHKWHVKWTVFRCSIVFILISIDKLKITEIPSNKLKILYSDPLLSKC